MASSLAMPDEFVLDFDAEEQAQHRAQELAPGQAPATSIGFNLNVSSALARPRVNGANNIGKSRPRQPQQQQRNDSPGPSASCVPGQDGRGTANLEPALLYSELDALRREIARREQQKKHAASNAGPIATRQQATAPALATRKLHKAPAASSSSGAAPADTHGGSAAVDGVRQGAPGSAVSGHVPDSGPAAPPHPGLKRAHAGPHLSAGSPHPVGVLASALAQTAALSASRSATATTATAGTQPPGGVTRGASSTATPASSEQPAAIAAGAVDSRPRQLTGSKRPGGDEGAGQAGQQAKRRQSQVLQQQQPHGRAQQSQSHGRQNGQQGGEPPRPQGHAQGSRSPVTGTARAVARPPRPHATREAGASVGEAACAAGADASSGIGLGQRMPQLPNSGPGANPRLHSRPGVAPPCKRMRVAAGVATATSTATRVAIVAPSDPAVASPAAEQATTRVRRSTTVGDSNDGGGNGDEGAPAAAVAAVRQLAWPPGLAPQRLPPSPGGAAEGNQEQLAPTSQDISPEAEQAATAFLMCFMSQMGGDGAVRGGALAAQDQAQLRQAGRRVQRQPPVLYSGEVGLLPEGGVQTLLPQPQPQQIGVHGVPGLSTEVPGRSPGAGDAGQQQLQLQRLGNRESDDGRAAQVPVVSSSHLDGQAAAAPGRAGSISARRAAAERTSAAVQRLRRKFSGAVMAEPQPAANRTLAAEPASGGMILAAAAATSTEGPSGLLSSHGPAPEEPTPPQVDVSPVLSLLALLEQAKAGLNALEDSSGCPLALPDATATATPQAWPARDPTLLSARAEVGLDGGAAAGSGGSGAGGTAATAACWPDAHTEQACSRGTVSGMPGSSTLEGLQAHSLAATGTEQSRLVGHTAFEPGAAAPDPDPMGAVGSPMPAAPPQLGSAPSSRQPQPSVHALPWVQVHAGGWDSAAGPQDELGDAPPSDPHYQPHYVQPQPHPQSQPPPHASGQYEHPQPLPQPYGHPPPPPPPPGSSVGHGFASETFSGHGFGAAPPAAVGAPAASGDAIDPAAAFGTFMGVPSHTAPLMCPPPMWLHPRPPGPPPMGISPYPYPLHTLPPHAMPPPPPPRPLLPLPGAPLGSVPGASAGVAWQQGPPGSVPLQGGQLVVSFAEADLLARKELCLIKWRMLQEVAAGVQAEWRDVCVAHNRLRLLSIPLPQQPPDAAVAPPPPRPREDTAVPSAAEAGQCSGAGEFPSPQPQAAGLVAAEQTLHQQLQDHRQQQGQQPRPQQQQGQKQQQQRQQGLQPPPHHQHLQELQRQLDRQHGLQEQGQRPDRVQGLDLEGLQDQGRPYHTERSGQRDDSGAPAGPRQSARDELPPVTSAAPPLADAAAARYAHENQALLFQPNPENAASSHPAELPDAVAAVPQPDACGQQAPGGQRPVHMAPQYTGPATQCAGYVGLDGFAAGQLEHRCRQPHAPLATGAAGLAGDTAAPGHVGSAAQQPRSDAPRSAAVLPLPATSAAREPAPEADQEHQWSGSGGLGAAAMEVHECSAAEAGRGSAAPQPSQEPGGTANRPGQPEGQGPSSAAAAHTPLRPHTGAGGALPMTCLDGSLGRLQYPHSLDSQLSQRLAEQVPVSGAGHATVVPASHGSGSTTPSGATHVTGGEPTWEGQTTGTAAPSLPRNQEARGNAPEATRTMATVQDVDGSSSMGPDRQDVNRSTPSVWAPWDCAEAAASAEVSVARAIAPGDACITNHRGGDSEAAPQEGESAAVAGPTTGTSAFTGLSFKLQPPGRRVGTLRVQHGGQVTVVGGGGSAGVGVVRPRGPAQRSQPAVSAVAAAAIVQPRRRSPAVASASAAAAPGPAAAAAEPSLRGQPAPQVRPLRTSDGREAGAPSNLQAHPQAAPLSEASMPLSLPPQPPSTSLSRAQWVPPPPQTAQQQQYQHQHYDYMNSGFAHGQHLQQQQQQPHRPQQAQHAWQPTPTPLLPHPGPTFPQPGSSPGGSQVLYDRLGVTLSAAGVIHRTHAAAVPSTTLEVLSTRYSSPLCMFRLYSANL